jgi:hypothetical protein
MTNMKQIELTQYFNYTPATFTKSQIPRDMMELITSFNKSTTESEILEGKQRTMTEFLDDCLPLEFCYEVTVYSKTRTINYGPFRHLEQALQRAKDVVSYGATDVQVLKYGSGFLDDRKGNWYDIGVEWVWDKESGLYSF